MILREGYVRITTGDHLGKIAVHNAEATWKVRRLRGEEGIGCGLSDQLVAATRYVARDPASSTASGSAIRAPVRTTSVRP